MYYPFADFSPEWQALRYALDRGIPARFMDLPVAHQFAEKETRSRPLRKAPKLSRRPRRRRPVDPLGMLAEAAGFDDGERWWEFVVESRRDGADMFAAIREAMAEVRAQVPAQDDLRELQREAHMRQTIRVAQREGHRSIAVICGAWHAPALVVESWRPAKDDAALLKGLPKTKVAATWVPWTYGRLARESGYGAGISSPGWYDHLWNAPDQVVERWLIRVARLLREERLDASSASVIEAVRLAEALATLRGRPLADLSDLEEATRTVLCFGEETPMRLIRRKLIVSERLGRGSRRNAFGSLAARSRTAFRNACGWLPIHRKPRRYSTCASPTTWNAADCCIVSACWASIGARSRTLPAKARSRKPGSFSGSPNWPSR